MLTSKFCQFAAFLQISKHDPASCHAWIKTISGKFQSAYKLTKTVTTLRELEIVDQACVVNGGQRGMGVWHSLGNGWRIIIPACCESTWPSPLSPSVPTKLSRVSSGQTILCSVSGHAPLNTQGVSIKQKREGREDVKPWICVCAQLAAILLWLLLTEHCALLSSHRLKSFLEMFNNSKLTLTLFFLLFSHYWSFIHFLWTTPYPRSRSQKMLKYIF